MKTVDSGDAGQLLGTDTFGSVKILHIYLSPGHNYFGHHGRPPGEHEVMERREIRCVAGRGLEGDRFFDYKLDYNGQITFFADEVHALVCSELGVGDRCPAAYRRNVVTRGLDLNALIGREFALQGVRFLGTGECKPCYWMNEALGPGAEVALRGRGGLRAKILSTGTLKITD